MIGNVPVEFLHQRGAGDPNLTARFHKSRQVVQVQIVGAVVHERVEAHDRIEERRRERQRPGIRMDWEDGAIDSSVASALEIVRCAEPQIRRPDLDAEFALQKIDDAAQPQPRSRTRNPGFSSRPSASHSVSQRELAPPLSAA